MVKPLTGEAAARHMLPALMSQAVEGLRPDEEQGAAFNRKYEKMLSEFMKRNRRLIDKMFDDARKRGTEGDPEPIVNELTKRLREEHPELRKKPRALYRTPRYGRDD